MKEHIGEHIAARATVPCHITALKSGFVPAMPTARARSVLGLDAAAMVKIIESES